MDHPNNCTCGCKHNNLKRDSKDKIVLNEIKLKNQYFGKIYYDITLDRLCFSNKNGNIVNLTNKPIINSINNITPFMGGMDGKEGPPGPPGKNAPPLVFKSLWKNDTEYCVNDIVIDKKDNSNLYICVNDNINIEPSKNNDYWSFFFGNNILFKGKWKGNIEYSENNLVIDDINTNIYICLNKTKDNIPPHQSKNYSLFMNTKGLFRSRIQEIDNMKLDLDNMIKDISDIADGNTNFKKEWVSDILYMKDDIVVDENDNRLYVCKNDIKSNISPSNDFSKWLLLNGDYYYKGEWDTSIEYNINSVVSYGSRLYVSQNDIIKNSQRPSLNNNWKRVDDGDVYSIGLRYRDIWKSGNEYKYNDMVKDNYGNLYIVHSRSSFVSSLEPSKDLDNWTFFSGNGFTFIGEWEKSKDYRINNVVKYNGSLYICNNNDDDNVEVNKSNRWRLLLSEEILGSNTSSVLFSFITNGMCCISYDKESRTSSFNFKKCINSHKPNTTPIYNPIEFDIKNECIYPVSFNYINKTCNFYSFNEKPPALYITSQGFYRITCNIAYYGTLYDFDCSVSVVTPQNRKPEEIIFSRNKSVNKYDDGGGDNISHFNYTFPFTIKERNIYQILLLLKFGKHNTGKKICILPVNTWITIERISS